LFCTATCTWLRLTAAAGIWNALQDNVTLLNAIRRLVPTATVASQPANEAGLMLGTTSF